MTEIELMELSLRARMAQAKGEHTRVFDRGKLIRLGATVYFNRFRISSNSEHDVMINRVGKAFFWHKSCVVTPVGPDVLSWVKAIKCTNDEWGMELLIQLRVAQILDNLASI